jgi:hypothetical protein
MNEIRAHNFSGDRHYHDIGFTTTCAIQVVVNPIPYDGPFQVCSKLT